MNWSNEVRTPLESLESDLSPCPVYGNVLYDISRSYSNEKRPRKHDSNTRIRIYIKIGCRVSLKALDSNKFRSKFVWDCVRTTSCLIGHNNVKLCLVTGQCGIGGNEFADMLATYYIVLHSILATFWDTQEAGNSGH